MRAEPVTLTSTLSQREREKTEVRLRLRLTIAATMLVDDFPHDPNRPPTSSRNIVGRCLTRS